MRLDGLVIADDPAAWEALGFALDGNRAHVGGVAIRLAGKGAGEGLIGWELDAAPGRSDDHPNGVVAVDHVVAVTGDLERAMAEVGEEPRRIREVPGGEVRQAFYVLETALLELAGPVKGEDSMRLWGVTLVAADIEALAARLGDLLGDVRDAVQPGRRIATLRREAGSSVPIAFMSPRDRSG